MARKKQRKAAKAAATAERPTVTVKIKVEPTEGTPSYYVNYAEVVHSRHEFAKREAVGLVASARVEPHALTASAFTPHLDRVCALEL